MGRSCAAGRLELYAVSGCELVLEKRRSARYGETASDTLTVRIFTRDAIAVDVGDMIAPGLVSAAVTSSADVLKMFPDSFKVLRIRDNRRGSLQMQHWRIEGE